MIRFERPYSMSPFPADTPRRPSRSPRHAPSLPQFAGDLGVAAPPAHAIALSGLTKTYGAGAAKPALDRVDLVIPRGALYGLLGPNAAGKSTLINILAGLVLKTAGRAAVCGIDIDADPRQARAAIGVVPHELNIDPS